MQSECSKLGVSHKAEQYTKEGAGQCWAQLSTLFTMLEHLGSSPFKTYRGDASRVVSKFAGVFLPLPISVPANKNRKDKEHTLLAAL